MPALLPSKVQRLPSIQSIWPMSLRLQAADATTGTSGKVFLSHLATQSMLDSIEVFTYYEL